MATKALLIALCVALSRALSIRRRAVTMRDTSGVYYFKAGDRVRITAPLLSKGESLLGRTGTVTSAWSKCEEDPHCCCAELAEEGVAVTVAVDSESGSFAYYFAEDELEQVRVPQPVPAAAALAAAATATAARAADSEPLLAAGPDKGLAVALVAPLAAYKISAMINNQKLMPALDVTVIAALGAAVYYCLPS